MSDLIDRLPPSSAARGYFAFAGPAVREGELVLHLSVCQYDGSVVNVAMRPDIAVELLAALESAVSTFRKADSGLDGQLKRARRLRPQE